MLLPQELKENKVLHGPSNVIRNHWKHRIGYAGIYDVELFLTSKALFKFEGKLRNLKDQIGRVRIINIVSALPMMNVFLILLYVILPPKFEKRQKAFLNLPLNDFFLQSLSDGSSHWSTRILFKSSFALV